MTEDTGGLPASCVANGCTADDCVCWEDELDDGDTLLRNAVGALHPGLELDSLGSRTGYIDGGRLLQLFDGSARGLRLYLDEPSGVVYTVPSDLEDAEDMRT